MKTLIQCLFFLLAFVFAYSLEAQMAPSIQWQKCLGGISEETAYCVRQTVDGGYLVSAAAVSHDGDVVGNHSLVSYSDAWVLKFDSTGEIVWKKCFGGSDDEYGLSIQQTSDGNYILASSAGSTNGDVSVNYGQEDYWIVKIGPNGDLLWEKSFGGSSIDFPYSIQQTNDDGFIIAGFTGSNDGDILNSHGGYDYWIVKLDSLGNLLWQRALGGSSDDVAYAVEQTNDGGFIVSGNSISNDGDVLGNHGGYDYWIVKLDSTGNLQWQKSLGGSDQDGNYGNGYTISTQQSNDGGFIVAGLSKSNDGDVSGNHGNYDYWIVKLDSGGSITWQKSYGGSNFDAPYSLQQTSDNGFIVAGFTESVSGDVSGNHGAYDVWLIKIDSAGNLIWQKCYGGSSSEVSNSVQQCNDGGFIFCGFTYSNDDDVSGLHGQYWEDCWVVKLSSDEPTLVAPDVTGTISLFPNPAHDILTIHLVTTPGKFSLHVYDVQGREVKLPISNFQSQTSNSLQFSTENLSPGFYTIQIINNTTGETEAGKFVKAE